MFVFGRFAVFVEGAKPTKLTFVFKLQISADYAGIY